MDDDQYGLSDLRQLISTRTGHFPAVSHPLEPFPGHRSSLPLFDPIHHAVVQHQYAPLSTGHAGFAAAVAPNTSSSAAAASLFGVDMDCGGRGGCLTEGGNSRWPRQETLTLLEIRSRLDLKFREANHKGPLWDEVSRIMSEEHGYQRSGKKCREKFENLYKYYKKTKEGKAGRQDGKNYRFFRQLEAIYGDTSSIISTTNNYTRPHDQSPYIINTFQDQAAKPSPYNCDNNNHSFSISNSSHDYFDTSSSENNEEYDLSAVAFMMSSQSRDKKKKQVGMDNNDRPIEGFKRRSSGWKEKVKSFVDSQMKKVIERQEIWMDSIVKSFEQREQERILREMEWKKQETERFDREHAMWAKERAWIEARDAALMEALKNKITGQGLVNVDFSLSRDGHHHHFHSDEMMNRMVVDGSVNETEILRLIQVRTQMEPRFQECGYNSSSSEDQGLWEVIAAKMSCMGHNLTAVECKDKWENIRSSFVKLTTTDHHSDRSSKG